ncbi:hypothetical protein [Altererythrobacter sp. GH1-8]|uniref:hypothetical protein n=1 Tax=Altererythrobacter sp. GH1-8 TaxID=3349333 RepID=UPI00374D0828
MRKLIIVASLAALAACAQDAEPEAEPEEAVEDAVPMAVDGGTLAGAYTSTGADGTVAVWTLAEDGTFTLETEGSDPVTGTFTNTDTETGANFCADPEGEEVGEICYAISTPAEDGSWTATDPEGNVLTIARRE